MDRAMSVATAAKTGTGRTAKAGKAGIRRINLALQGGGAHGAFTWGVIDRLLDEPDIEFEGLSGTSAGAVNAVVLAHGLMEGRAHRRAGGARGFLAPLQPRRLGLVAGQFPAARGYSRHGIPLGRHLRGLRHDDTDLLAL